MKDEHVFPDGWTSAVHYFSRCAKEELIQHKLPTASKDRRGLLRHLYTNGIRFVYCRGGLNVRYDQQGRTQVIFTAAVLHLRQLGCSQTWVQGPLP